MKLRQSVCPKSSSANLDGIDVAVRQDHRRVVLVHDRPADATNNTTIEMVREWEFFRQRPQQVTAHGAVDILICKLETAGCFQCR
jgi:hypothetical protein